MSAAAGKRKTKVLTLPSGSQYDLPLLQAAGNDKYADSIRIGRKKEQAEGDWGEGGRACNKSRLFGTSTHFVCII